ncbi:MAG: TA system VapC family ribonuclease toxin [Verrucomicrobiota bacterium]
MFAVDVNLLIYAVNADAAEHEVVRSWLETEINAGTSIGVPWIALLGFIRLSINPKVLGQPLTLDQALHQVHDWLSLPNVFVLEPGIDHLSHFTAACQSVKAGPNLITDAHLAAIVMEHGATMASCDTDFGRFPGLPWVNPLNP